MGSVARQPRAAGVVVAYTGGGDGASYTDTRSPDASAATDPIVRTYAEDLLPQMDVVRWASQNSGNGRATLSTATYLNLRGSYSCWKVGST